MIKLKLNFMSKAIMRNVNVNIIMPKPSSQKPFKTLYLLHGMYGDYEDWLTKSNIINYIDGKDIAVVMPNGDNSFYVDNNFSGEKFGTYIGKELVQFTRSILPLSTDYNETFIAGLSMGGFGAVRAGLKYNNTFGLIAGFSSALITNRIINMTKENSASITHMDPAYYQTIFDGQEILKTSDKNPQFLISELLKKGAKLPKLYLACGTEDFLLEDNRHFVNFLKESNVEHTYIESPGTHDWTYWDDQIKNLIEILP